MKPKINNHQFYLESHKKHGVSARGVRWNSKHNQYIRFENLLNYLEEKIEDSSLLDIGCGYGHLINYFQEKHIYPKSYIGIDCESFMIDKANKRFPSSQFLRKNFLNELLPQADYYLCSGAFNTLEKTNVLKAIKLCYEQSHKGFVFNILTNAFIHDLSAFDIYIFCQGLTKNVQFKGNYLENDYTFFLEK